MNLYELSKLTSQELGLPRPQVEQVLESVRRNVIAALEHGDEISLQGIGRIVPSAMPSVTRMNNFTKTPMKLPARVKLRFYPKPALVSRINAYLEKSEFSA